MSHRCLHSGRIFALMPTLAAESDQRAKAPELEVEQLTLERDRYADLFELAPDAYLVTDPYGIIMEANAAATRLFEACAASLRAKALDLFIPLEQRGVFRGKLAAMAANPGAERATWRGGLRCAHRDIQVAFTVGRIKHRALPMVSLCWLVRPL
jgi:PAS domain S-box-containing protein